MDLKSIKDKIVLSQFASQVLGCKIYKGGTMCCHLHSEKSPSMHLNDEKRFYYCFGCHKSGDVFSLIQEIKFCSFLDAIKIAAEYAGITIPDNYQFAKTSPEAAQRKEIIYKMMEDICLYFENLLFSDSSKGQLEYLYSRGLNEQTIKHFRIGYCPKNQNDLIKFLKQKYARNINLILDSGIFKKNTGYVSREDSGFYNILQERVIFPIFDKFNRIIAFGGRLTLNEVVNSDQAYKKPKYINASDSLIFKKSEEMYGQNFALAHAKKENEMLVVEGYLDVIAMQQNKFKNTVAPLGTAISEHQINSMWSVCDNIKFAFDGDNAGIGAMKAALKKALPIMKAGKFVCFVVLPAQQDPASLIFDNKCSLLETSLKKVIYPAELIVRIIWNKYKNSNSEFAAAMRKDFEGFIELLNDDLIKKEYQIYFDAKMKEIFATKQKTSDFSNKYKYVPNSNTAAIYSIYEELFCICIILICNDSEHFRQYKADYSDKIKLLLSRSHFKSHLKQLYDYVLNALDDSNFASLNFDNIKKNFYHFRELFDKADDCIINLDIDNAKTLWQLLIVKRLDLILIKEEKSKLQSDLTQVFDPVKFNRIKELEKAERELGN